MASRRLACAHPWRIGPRKRLAPMSTAAGTMRPRCKAIRLLHAMSIATHGFGRYGGKRTTMTNAAGAMRIRCNALRFLHPMSIAMSITPAFF